MSGQTAMQLARIHAQTIAGFPEPPETFRLRDVELLNHDRLNRFRMHGVLRKAGRVDPNDLDSPFLYKVNEEVYDLASDYYNSRDRLSCCGSTGVSNEDGELICNMCGAAVDEEEFRRVCRI